MLDDRYQSSRRGSAGPIELLLEVESHDGTSAALELRSPHLVIAGFTGRDSAIVDRHVQELGAHGVAAPAEVPCYWVLPNWLLAVEPAVVQVTSSATSGEAEPVVVRMPDGASYVTVGSDHTDRGLEKTSLGLAKLACPKVLASTVWPLEDVRESWDAIRLSSSAGGACPRYQDDCLATIREPADLMARIGALGLDRSRPLIAFLGTVPLVKRELVFSGSFSASLEDRRAKRSLTIAYNVEEVAVRSPDLDVTAHA